MPTRFPAEWEDQDGILLSWPHPGTDWSDSLKTVTPVFIRIAAEAGRFGRVVIACPDPAAVRALLAENGAVMKNILCEVVPANDTWARDFGPLTVKKDGRPVLLDFTFNAWGLKFAADRDNLVTRELYKRGVFRRTAPLKTLNFVLEGGSVESDGAGTVMTTEQCLLSPNRNPQFSKKEIETVLKKELGVKKVLWIPAGAGHLEGDDTDAHIDTLARFCPGRTIAFVSAEDADNDHAPGLRRMEKELKKFRDAAGRPYRLVPLPFPKAVRNASRRRLPLTYANFLAVNGAVLAPVYGDRERDRKALSILQSLFPGREIVGVDCLPLVHQFGSLHCVTMQLPKGVLS